MAQGIRTQYPRAHRVPFESAFGLVLTKLDPSGALLFASVLSVETGDHAGGIAVDASGNIYVVDPRTAAFPF